MTQFFVLSTAEAEATKHALDVLDDASWSNGLRQQVTAGGGLVSANMSFLFEARFALALHDCGIEPEYEHATGVGNTSVDFQFGPWFVELLSLQESEAAKAATWEAGPFFGRFLSSPQPPSPDEHELGEAERKQLRDLRKQSPERETLRAIGQIVGKAGDEKRPAKFPPPDGSHLSMLIVDLRALGRALGSIDRADCRQIAYGAGAVPDWAKHRWIADDGRELPLAGAFHRGNTMKGASHFRERVHFLGLVSEERYDREEMQYLIRFYHNPGFFASEEEALAVLRSFPLFQPDKRRERRPDLFLHELFEQSDREIRFGIMAGGRTVTCHVHLDTLEDLEKRSLKPGSDEMLQAFYRSETRLERLAA